MNEPIGLTKEQPTQIERKPASGAVRRRARSAVARSQAGDRSLAVLLGAFLLVAGALVTLLSFGVFGAGRAMRPLLDPMIVEGLRANPQYAVWGAIGTGVLLMVLGLVWAARSVRPEHRPDLLLEPGTSATRIVVNSSAAAEAIAGQAAALPGVQRARARLLGTDTAPALRLTLWLNDQADLREVLARVDDTVLATARQSLELHELPVAVRIELDAPSSSSTPPRVQ